MKKKEADKMPQTVKEFLRHTAEITKKWVREYNYDNGSFSDFELANILNDYWDGSYLENLSTIEWEFVNKEDEKKCVWWNPLDWIPKFFNAR